MSPQAYQNGRQTFQLVSGHYTLLNHSLVHQGWAQTLALERRKRVSAHSVGVMLVYELASVSDGRTQLESPQPPDAGGPGLVHPLLAAADADELSFQEVGFGVAPPQAGVAPPHPVPVPPVLAAYGFGVRTEPQAGVLPPSCCVYGFGVWELVLNGVLPPSVYGLEVFEEPQAGVFPPPVTYGLGVWPLPQPDPPDGAYGLGVRPPAPNPPSPKLPRGGPIVSRPPSSGSSWLHWD